MLPELSKIIFDVQAEFHMLRHFSLIDDGLVTKLLGLGFSNNQIQSEISQPGSRFDPKFASSISEVLKRMLSPESTLITGLNGNLNVTRRFNSLELSEGVGSVAVIPISEVETSKLAMMEIRTNRGIALRHLKVDILPRTWECSLILKPQSDHSLFITAFPGPPALPLPIAEMSTRQYEACTAFWNQHVFLVEKGNEC